ncbi:MAG: ABC transporter permease [Burkholderiales bacterium]|nr:ABC transporter permease [Burkholderiales bacterium]
MNAAGFQTLLYKELLRFWKVSVQTIAAPVLTALLYLLVFSHVLAGRVEAFPGVPYTAFLVPGLVMMSMLQNAFANSSSSLIQSKMTGNIVFILLPPLGPGEIFAAFLLASVVRGVAIGVGVYVAGLTVTAVPLPNPLWALAFALIGTGILGNLGIIAGIWADKFDQIAAFQNFVVMPLTFLSGVFYSIHSLPPFWLALSRANPVFYLIDGFRFGFFGHADVNPWLSLCIASVSFLALSFVILIMLQRGYKLRH